MKGVLGLDGWFGDVVFVHESKLAENAVCNVRRLIGAELLVHICRHKIVKGLADLGGVVYTVVAEFEHTSHMHVIVCE